MAQSIHYKILIYKCLDAIAPSYLSALYSPTASDQFRSRLRSALSGDLIVPSSHTALGVCSYAIAGPHSWNELPVDIRDPTLSLDRFRLNLRPIFLILLTLWF